MSVNAQIIIIGDELLLGLIRDTNSGYLIRELTALGVTVTRVITVGDDTEAITGAFRAAASGSDIVISCGGLGPTHDDRTRFAVAAFLNTPLQMNAEALEEINQIYRRSGRTMSESNRIQAMIPAGARYLTNPMGTAPGITFQFGQTTYYILQGIPREMEAMFEKHIRPALADPYAGKRILFRTIRTTGIPESVLYESVKDAVERYSEKLSVAFLPKLTVGVDIRLTAANASDRDRPQLLTTALQEFTGLINSKWNHAVYGYDEETIEAKVADLLFKTGRTIATAESCTGGLIAHRLTNIPGSSKYFLQGMITYSNESKIKQLGVHETVLQQYGAVSEATAIAMAEGIRKLTGADIGLAVTGIAGPSGGTESKPVGTVYIALAAEQKTEVGRPFKLLFEVDRISFKERTAQFALDTVRKHLLNLG